MQASVLLIQPVERVEQVAAIWFCDVKINQSGFDTLVSQEFLDGQDIHPHYSFIKNRRHESIVDIAIKKWNFSTDRHITFAIFYIALSAIFMTLGLNININFWQ